MLEFLARLLSQVTLQAGADDFPQTAFMVIKAKNELAEALATGEAEASATQRSADQSPGSSES